jgi:hypothetical protein
VETRYLAAESITGPLFFPPSPSAVRAPVFVVQAAVRIVGFADLRGVVAAGAHNHARMPVPRCVLRRHFSNLAAVVPSTFASFASNSKLGVASPCSSWQRYTAVIPARRAVSRWVRPARVRAFANCLPRFLDSLLVFMRRIIPQSKRGRQADFRKIRG